MSQVSVLRSKQIAGRDQAPPLPTTSGESGIGILRTVDGFVTALTADTTASVYLLARVPTNAKLKKVGLFNDALSASTTLDVGLYYSDAPAPLGSTPNPAPSPTIDGSPPALAGTAVNATLFGSATAATSANINLDLSLTIDKQVQPLWQAAGLSSDPGGFFDISVVPHVAVVAGGKIGIRVDFVM